jgi:hypothetical protein
MVNLDDLQIEAIVVGDKIDGKTQMAEAPRAAHSMQVGLGRLWEVKIDDDIH